MGLLDELIRKAHSLAGGQPASAPRPRERRADTRFRAVSVRPGDESCEAARQLGQLRYLCAEAPRLPLPECNAATCNCGYWHHSDRRSGLDRRAAQDWTRERELGVVNRRSSHGRRSTDAVA